MAEALIGPVGIEFQVVGIQKVNADFDAMMKRFNTNWTSAMGGMSTAGAAANRKILDDTTTTHQKLRTLDTQTASIQKASIQTVEQFRQEWAGKSTRTLVSFIKQESDMRTNAFNQYKADLATGNRLQAQADKQQLDSLSAILRTARQVSIERKGVQFGGMGAVIGQLGIGRDLSGIGAGALGPLGGVVGGLSAIGPAGIAAAAAIGATTVSLKKVIDVGREFDSQITQTIAVFGNVTEQQKQRMISTALEVSKETNETAADVAKGYYWLASAGMGVEQAMAAIPAVARFAKAGVFDLAEATQLAVGAQNALGMASLDAQKNQEGLIHVTDVLTTANNEASGTIESYSQAITNKAGAAMKVYGQTIEQGTAVLMAFANENVQGQEAGEAYSIVMKDLAKAGLNNEKAWKANGMAVYDASGKMKDTAIIMKELEDRMDGMTDKQKQSLLMGKEGLGFQERSVQYIEELLGSSQEILDYEDKLNNASGATAKTAATQMESFDEHMKHLEEVFDAELIPIFYKLEPYLIEIVDWAGTHLPAAIGIAVPALKAIGEVAMDSLAPIYMQAKALEAVWDSLHGNFTKAQGDLEAGGTFMLKHNIVTTVGGWVEGGSDDSWKNNQDLLNAGYGDSGSAIPGLGRVGDFPGLGDLGLGAKKKKVTSVVGGKDDPKADKKAFAAGTDVLRNAMSERLDIYISQGHSVEETLIYQRQLTLQYDEEEYQNALKHHQRNGELHLKIQQERIDIEKAQEEINKKALAASEKTEKAQEKIIDAHFKAIVKNIEAENKLQEKQAKTRATIEKKLEDQTDASIADKTKRETAQENRKYEREMMEIIHQNDGTVETKKLIDEQLELLEKDHQAKLTQIADDGSTKAAKSVDKLSTALNRLGGEYKTTTDLASNWGEIVSTAMVLVVGAIERSKNATNAVQAVGTYPDAIPGIPGTGHGAFASILDFKSGSLPTIGSNPLAPMPMPDWNNLTPAQRLMLMQSMTTGNIPAFHDTPGTLAQSGALHVGGGKYLAYGDGDDRLVKEDTAKNTPFIIPTIPLHLDPPESIRERSRKAREQDKKYGGDTGVSDEMDPTEWAAMILTGGTSAAMEGGFREFASGGAKAALEKLMEAHPLMHFATEFEREGLKTAVEKLATKYAPSLLASLYGRSSIFHSGILGSVPGLSFGAHVPGTTAYRLPTFNDSPPLGQTDAPAIGDYRLALGHKDDFLIKGSSITESFRTALDSSTRLKEIGASTEKTSEHSKKSSEKLSDGSETGKSFLDFQNSPLHDALTGQDAKGNKVGLLSGADMTKQIMGDIPGAASSIYGAINYQPPKQQTQWNGYLNKPMAAAPTHNSALGILDTLGPMAANLLLPGSGALVSAGMNALGLNADQQQSFNPMSLLGGAAGLVGLADGTDFTHRTGSYIVGEKRPEVVHLPRGSAVDPHPVFSANEPYYGPRGGSGHGMNGSSGRMHPDDIAAIGNHLARAMQSAPAPVIQTSSFRSGLAKANNHVNTFT